VERSGVRSALNLDSAALEAYAAAAAKAFGVAPDRRVHFRIGLAKADLGESDKKTKRKSATEAPST